MHVLILIHHHMFLASGGASGTTGGSGFVLPASHPVNPINTVLGNLVVTAMNWVLGVFGLLVIATGMYRFLAVVWNQYRGKDTKYEHGFVSSSVATAPKALMAGIDVLVGIVIAGMFLSGAWVGLADGLIRIGAHISQTIGHQL